MTAGRLRRVATALAAAVLATAAVSACGTPSERPPLTPLPPGTPPPPGAPVPPVDLAAPGRTAEQLAAWASPIAATTRIPLVALEAYGNAADALAASRPGCGLAWTTLAGIGWVESRHGTYRGSHLDAAGVETPPLSGIPLTGQPGFASIAPGAGGTFEQDPDAVRALGPMQFLPETWQRIGVDANGDGKADPQQIDDAATTAGILLCSKGGDLTTKEGWTTAVLAYNQSGDYVQAVRDAAAAYSIGVPARS